MLIKRVARAYRMKMAGACVQYTGSDRVQFMEPVWDMYVKTYRSIGLTAKSAEEVLGEFAVWEICHDDDGLPVAFTVFKKTSFGLKSGLSGSDGSPAGKANVLNALRTKFKRPGYYGEVSHKVEAIALAAGAPVVCNFYAPKVLGKPVEPEEDGLHYSRMLANVGRVTKILVGKPKGIPTTSYENPSCPVEGSKLAFEFDRIEDDGMDKIAHAFCEFF
jgi:hypothetical protein